MNPLVETREDGSTWVRMPTMMHADNPVIGFKELTSLRIGPINWHRYEKPFALPVGSANSETPTTNTNTKP